MNNRVLLTWPDRAAHPNERVHWSRKSKANKTMRRAAYYLGKQAGLYAPQEGPIHVSLTFFPPDKRKRDLDGCISNCKAYLDGIADAMGVDDNRFTLSAKIVDGQPGGCVVMEVRS